MRPMSQPLPHDANAPRASLPAGHPLEARLAQLARLRDELIELNARLETLRLMARLQQR